MGIDPKDFAEVWKGIAWWMQKRRVTEEWLNRYTRYGLDKIQRGLSTGAEWITSEFVHDCVHALGVSPARNQSADDLADALSDEECVRLLTAPLRRRGG